MTQEAFAAECKHCFPQSRKGQGGGEEGGGGGGGRLTGTEAVVNVLRCCNHLTAATDLRSMLCFITKAACTTESKNCPQNGQPKEGWGGGGGGGDEIGIQMDAVTQPSL